MNWFVKKSSFKYYYYDKKHGLKVESNKIVMSTILITTH